MSEVRGSSAGRPRVPWLSKIGSNPVPPTDGQVARRAIVAVLVIFNPVLTAVFLVLRLTLGRTPIRAKWVIIVGAIASIVCFLTRQIGAYNTPWRELARTVAELESLATANASLAATLSHWPAWLVDQMPFALSAGVLLAGLSLGYRERYSATWRATSRRASRRTMDKALRKARDYTGGRPATSVDDLSVRLGADEQTGQVVEIPAAAFRSHTIIGGPTGAGKSTTIMKLVDGLLGNPAASSLRLPAIMVDLKADEGMRKELEALAAATGRRCHVITVDGTGNTTYNPLRSGSPDQIKNKLIEAEASSADGGFSEPHYRRLGERFLLLACAVLEDLVTRGATLLSDGVRRPWRQDLRDLVRLMDLNTLGTQLDLLSPAVAARVNGYLEEVANNKNLATDIYGIYNRYALIADGPAGSVLVDSPDGLDLYDAIMAGDLVLFSLDAGLDGATARQLGSLVLQDLISVMSRLKAEDYARTRFCLTIVDEFSALGGSSLRDLFARSRSAGGAVVLASQDLDADLEAVSPEFASAVKTNANIVVLHRQTGDAASGWAERLGTHQTWTETLQIQDDIDVYGTQSAASGVGSLRQTDEFIVHPNTLKTLGQGVVILNVNHPKRTIRTVHVARAATRATAPDPVPATKAPTAVPPPQDGVALVKSAVAPARPAESEPMVRTPHPQPFGQSWAEAGRTVAAKSTETAEPRGEEHVSPARWDDDDYDE